MKCAFCDIIQGAVPAEIVFADDATIAFLDNRPLFPGHVLLVPREHVETMADLPDNLIANIAVVKTFAEKAAE